MSKIVTTGGQLVQKIIFVIGAIALLSTTTAMAQQGQVIRECAADIRAACGDVPAGAGAIRMPALIRIWRISPPAVPNCTNRGGSRCERMPQ